MGLFRKGDLEVIRIGTWAMRFQCLTLPFQAWIIMSNMLTQSIGYGFRASIVAAGRQGIFLIPALLTLPRFLGILGLQLCQPIADVCTSVMAAVIVVSILKELKVWNEEIQNLSKKLWTNERFCERMVQARCDFFNKRIATDILKGVLK